jgi:hypothetical protein
MSEIESLGMSRCPNHRVSQPTPMHSGCVESILSTHLPAEELAAVRRILYGTPTAFEEDDASEHSALHQLATEVAAKYRDAFDVRAYCIPCPREQRREARIVRVAVIQNSIAVCATLIGWLIGWLIG